MVSCLPGGGYCVPGEGPGDPAGLGLGVPGGGDSRGLEVLGNKGYPRGLADPEWVLNDLNFN